MGSLAGLLNNNTKWAAKAKASDPEFFTRLYNQQTPQYLWIGCSDSRVPANQIVGLDPGELFVHRNVANVVVHTDLNCLSVMQYAVEVLKVKHIIVCGHYGCGGVAAALQNLELGLITNWLRHIQDVVHANASDLDAISDERERTNRLCELNVVHQAINVARTTIVQEAWKREQDLTVHGLIYSLKSGLIKDLQVSMCGQGDLGKLI